MPKFDIFQLCPSPEWRTELKRSPPASMNSQTSHPANHFHVAAAPLNGKHSRNEFTKPSSRWFRVKCFRVDFTRFRRTTPTIFWNCKSSGWWSFQFWMKTCSDPKKMLCHPVLHQFERRRGQGPLVTWEQVARVALSCMRRLELGEIIWDHSDRLSWDEF